MYADDLVIIAENEMELTQKLGVLNRWCTTNEMTVNEAKCGIMVVTPEERDRGTVRQLKVGALTINAVEEYKYLEAVLKKDLSWDHIVKERAEAGRGALGGLTKCLTYRQIPTWVKLRIVNSVLMPPFAVRSRSGGRATQRVTPLQKIADRALKLVYGTRGNAPANAMRAEASMLPVGELIRGEFKHPERTLVTGTRKWLKRIMEILKTQKGKDMLQYNEKLYVKNKETIVMTRWRCK
ncbi:hypothetical protein HZS_5437, partial [Henneguya salminicola]